MNELLSKDGIAYIVSRVLDNAKDAKEEYENNRDDAFYQGKNLAYYEILDTIKNELEIKEEDLKDYGLDLLLEDLL